MGAFRIRAWFVLVFLQGVPYAYLGSLPAGAPTPAWASATAALWFLSLSFVPISLAIAVLRYRLYDIDVIINRALVYGGLTAILAGLYAASISLFQRLFTAVTGNKSDAAIVLTTLVLASVFTPLRTRLQSAVDSRFKDVHDPPRRLRALTDEVRQGIWILNGRQATLRILTEAAEAFSATGGAAYWRSGRREHEIGRVGDWKPPGSVQVDVATPQRVLGRMALGPKQDGSAYSAEDTTALGEAAAAVALAALGSAAPTKGSTRRPIRRTARRTPRPVRRSTRR